MMLQARSQAVDGDSFQFIFRSHLSEECLEFSAGASVTAMDLVREIVPCSATFRDHGSLKSSLKCGLYNSLAISLWLGLSTLGCCLRCGLGFGLCSCLLLCGLGPQAGFFMVARF